MIVIERSASLSINNQTKLIGLHNVALWGTLEHYGGLWSHLNYSKILWNTLEHSKKLSKVLLI